ncbi:unnamed protein product, partial [Durusdinium trenchii]
HSESPQVEVAQGDPLWGQRMEQSLASLEPLVEATSRSLQPGSAETAQSNQAQLQGLQPGRSESPRAVAGRAVVVEITEPWPCKLDSQGSKHVQFWGSPEGFVVDASTSVTSLA